MTELSLRDIACVASSDHISQLNLKAHHENHDNFIRRMTSYDTSDNKHNDLEQELLHGIQITNKNCYYQRPQESKGNWEKQFNSVLVHNHNMFDFQTKRRYAQ